MRNTFLTLSFGLIALASFSQQDILASQFWNFYSHFNPSSIALNHDYEGAIGYRDQWEQVNGAPRSLLVNYAMKIKPLRGALGMSYSFDKVGFSRSQMAHINYNYQQKLKGYHKISAGISAGMMQLTTNPDWIPPTQVPDSSLGSVNDLQPDFNAGITYNYGMSMVGVGITHITQRAYKSNVTYIKYSAARHFYLHGNYYWKVTPSFVIQPQALFRTDWVYHSLDVNAIAMYKRKYWLGLGYRTSDALMFMGGFTIKDNFSVGYSYDHTINKLQNISQGTHEIVLGFNILTKPTELQGPPNF